ncbi:hypothetical protein NS303_16005 [Pantoea ananatis]|uniref:hypothetical protein n=1 Tax=Pantoea TaxID=53335 RepID=UPI0007368D3A|nr:MULTISPECIES: hypothetical protein [Pantoea]KTR47296.1 hypothetical protein NS303_16005 [Pantoea ananatis]KTR56416.1 hypothetical protein NS311_07810 [Pantoea ananatis]KTR62960.1 hypothetical protein RSA47_19690 [Pantoea ananatis]KTR73011.1 hypothetical protein NS296_00110 [Pantoea ananatis]MCS3403246.1 hypothetical protein [Pantoea sp. B566]
MSSIMLSLITRLSGALNRLAGNLQQQQAEWFTNRSGRCSFKADVVPTENGFTPVISRRTGFTQRDWHIDQLPGTGTYATARKALRAGRLMAQQMAELRYRFD